MTISGPALPAVSYCTETSDYNRLLNSSGNMRTLNRIDSQVRQVTFALQWTDAEPEVVDAIQQHYEAHAAGTFRWQAPTDSATTTWRYIDAPTIQWATARSASIAVEVERTLAFIT
jgi:hypothetical protein